MSKRTFYILCVIKNQKFFKKRSKNTKKYITPIIVYDVQIIISKYICHFTNTSWHHLNYHPQNRNQNKNIEMALLHFFLLRNNNSKRKSKFHHHHYQNHNININHKSQQLLIRKQRPKKMNHNDAQRHHLYLQLHF